MNTLKNSISRACVACVLAGTLVVPVSWALDPQIVEKLAGEDVALRVEGIEALTRAGDPA